MQRFFVFSKNLLIKSTLINNFCLILIKIFLFSSKENPFFKEIHINTIIENVQTQEKKIFTNFLLIGIF